MPPGRCGTGVPLDELHPGDAAEITRFRAYLADVAAGVADGMDRYAAEDAALATHYPDLRTCTSPARCAPGQAPAGISYEP